MPKSDFWKFDSSNGPEPWIRNTRGESQKIDSMTSDELIDYIKNFTLAPPAASDIRNLFESLRFRTLEYGNGLIYYAQDIFILEMQQLFSKLKRRLKNFEKKLDINTLRNHFNDTKNIKAVMDVNIQTSDYTVLFLVHRHMVQKRMELTKKWNEIRKCRRDLLWFIHRLEVCIERKLNPGAVIPLSFY